MSPPGLVTYLLAERRFSVGAQTNGTYGLKGKARGGHIMSELNISAAESAVVLRRFRAGLERRLAATRKIQQDDLPAEGGRRRSVFEALDGRLRPGLYRGAKYGGDDRWIFVIASLSAPSVSTQRETILSISDPQDAAFNALFALGAIAHPAEIDIQQLLDCADSDLSVLIETLGNAGRLPPVMASAVSAIVTSFVEQIRQKPKRHGRGFNQIAERLSTLWEAQPPSSLSELSRFVTGLRSSRLHVIGPDFPAALQILCDPLEDPTRAQLEQIHSVMSRWGLEDTFGALLLLRSAGDYIDSSNYLLEHGWRLLTQNQLLDNSASVGGLIDGLSPTLSPLPKRTGYFDLAASLLWNFKVALRRQDAWSVFTAIAALYDHDPSLVSFLPWTSIYDLYIEWTEIAVETTFASMLMADDNVIRRYPDVAFAAGTGAFIADLTSLIRSNPGGATPSALVASFRQLPRRAGEALTLAVLQRPIVERLSSSVSRTSARRRLGVRTNEIDPISSLRVEMLHLGRSKRLVDAEFVEQQLQNEFDHIALTYLQGRQRVGRVRMRWGEIAKDLEIQFENNLPIASLRQAVTLVGIPQALRERVSSFSGEQIANHVLYESEHGVDQALSNNLRHGVVLPRFLRAFEDAFQASFPDRSLVGWEAKDLRLWFDVDGGLVANLRDGVADTIRRFIAFYLTIEKGKAFERDLVQLLAQLVETSLSDKGQDAQHKLEQRTVAAIKSHLAKALREASRALHREVRRRLSDLVNVARQEASEGLRPVTSSFLATVESNLETATDEVRSWLHISDGRGAAISVQLQQLVKLHLLSTSLYKSDAFKVTCAVEAPEYASAGRSIEISGKYVDFFDVLVSNLLSNAFNKSGDRLKTQATFTVKVSDGRMVIRCENLINESRIQKVIDLYPHTLDLARQPLSRNVNRDKLSGFQKIRNAYRTTLRTVPTINIPPISQRNRRFVIEIHSPAPEDLLA